MKLSFRNIVAVQFLFSGLVLILLSRRWVSSKYLETGFPAVSLNLTANDLVPALSGLAIAAMASTLGAISTRGFARRVVGAFITAIGLGIILVTIDMLQNLDRLIGAQFADAIGRNITDWTQQSSIYPWVVIPAGAVIAVCGLLMAFKTFEAQLSKRYEREQIRVQNLTPWQSLDHGVDPTVETEIT